MSRYLNAISQATDTIRLQRWTIGVMGVVTVLSLWGWKAKDTQLTAHIPPDLSNGAVIKIGGQAQVPTPNVYSFAFYIWQQVNNWPKDGNQDYGKQIYDLQFYFTPACREQLTADLKSKSAAAELSFRTRAVMEIPGQGYSANRVTDHGNGTWTVLLDTALQETSRGMRVKDVYVRWPLRVVRFDVSRENNPWGLAIDCFGDRRPERLSVENVKDIKLTPMASPSTAVPAVLPQPVAPLPQR